MFEIFDNDIFFSYRNILAKYFSPKFKIFYNVFFSEEKKLILLARNYQFLLFYFSQANHCEVQQSINAYKKKRAYVG